MYDFFDNTLPDHVSYVITTHLYPHVKSLLTEMIRKHAAIEVHEVQEDMLIEPDKVYVMPENKVMHIKEGRLILLPRDLDIKVNNAIDIFFGSLALTNDFNIVAIILSGMGSDGTKSVEAISKKGGVIIAQDLQSADNDSMPQSVIASGYSDYILDPKAMPAQIIKIVKNFERGFV